MKPQRPYLMRALYEWIVDSNATPYVLVKVDSPDVRVPQDYVEDGQIILNVSPSAVRDLQITETELFFDGRFGGHSFDVWVPLSSVAAIYAKENGQGMMFSADDNQIDEPAADSGGSGLQSATVRQEKDASTPAKAAQQDSSARRDHLKVIK